MTRPQAVPPGTPSVATDGGSRVGADDRLAIDVDGLELVYSDGTAAVAGLDMAVPEGEFFGFLGPNGAGKTTTFNLLVGLVRKTGGEARVFGHDVETADREARDRSGLAPPDFNVHQFFPTRGVP